MRNGQTILNPTRFISFTTMNNNKKANKQDRKQKLKEDLEKAKESKAKLAVPYAATDLLDTFNAFRKFEKNGINVALEYHKGENISKELFNFCFDLTKKNMFDLYEDNWGWSDSGKKSEMKEDDALYIIVFDVSGQTAQNNNSEDKTADPLAGKKPVGFVHFRFVYEEEKKTEVIYVYEIQLIDQFTRKGLGKFIMQLMELMAIKYKMSWVMLTVFKDNDGAMQFYKGLKYTFDESSPCVTDPMNEEGHEIMSKSFVKYLTAAKK